jgi:hypothetical protein
LCSTHPMDRLITSFWFLLGSGMGFFLVELLLLVLYCLPKAVYLTLQKGSSTALVLLFLKAVAYRSALLLLLWLPVGLWGFPHHRALALGMALVLSGYATYTFRMGGTNVLATIFTGLAEGHQRKL